MMKGIYIAVSAATTKQAEMDTITHNLANTNTTGYKKETISFKDYMIPQANVSSRPDGRAMSEVYVRNTDFSNGNLIRTGNDLDIAIDGNGFIALEGGLYTRRGDLKRSVDGYLVAYGDRKVLGNNGPIRLPEGAVTISDTGNVLAGDIVVDTLKVVDFEKKEELTREGEEIFSAKDNGVKTSAKIRQGYLETSNVGVVNEMVHMIAALREYESFQKAIQTFDEAMAKVNNDMGRF